MKRIRSTHLIVAVAALLVLSLALAFAEEKETVKLRATDENVLILAGDGEPITLELDDLKDGESRVFEGKHGKVTVTRKGDTLEIDAEGEGKERRHMVVTCSKEGGDKMLVMTRPEGGTAKTITLHVDSEDEGHGAWITEDGEEIELEMLADELEWHGDPGEGKHRVIVRRIGEGGAAKMMTFVGSGDDLMWVGESDGKVFRCADDELTVSVPAAKLKGQILACPICGRQMKELEPGKVKMMKLEVVEEKDTKH